MAKGKPRSSKGLAALCAQAADDKKALDIMMLDLTELDSAPSDFFVICTCQSEPQLSAVVLEIQKQTKEVKVPHPRVEGLDGMEWAIIDYFDVVVHVMLENARKYYKLEKLWADASFSTLTETGSTRKLKQKELMEFIMGDESAL